MKQNNNLSKTKNIVWIIGGILFIITLIVIIYTIMNLPSLLSGLIDLDIPDF